MTAPLNEIILPFDSPSRRVASIRHQQHRQAGTAPPAAATAPGTSGHVVGSFELEELRHGPPSRTRWDQGLADTATNSAFKFYKEEEQQEEIASRDTDRLLDLEGGALGVRADTNSHMNRKTRSKAAAAAAAAAATPTEQQPASIISEDHAQATSANGEMLGRPLEHRRRFSTADGSIGSHVAPLQTSSRYSFDKELPRSATSRDGSGHGDDNDEDSDSGIMSLPLQDRNNFLVLVLLYFLQGIPMGLAGGSVPFLLKSHLSYGQIGIFSLAIYPYSLKLLWSPIVDAVWSPRFGRRKSWILPIQTLSGLGMVWLGGRAESMMVAAGANGGAGVWAFTWWWFFLVFTCATQDIAVDGWAITLLSQKHVAYASTAQTVGLTGGQFLSYTVFLAFNSPDFANKWFRATPSPEGLMTLGGYLTFWGWAYLVVTLGLAVLKREDKTKDRDSIMEVYKVIGGIIKLRNVQTIIIIHLIAKIGFQANDGVTNLKLLDKGFSQEDLALTVLIDFPFELGLGYYIGKWSSVYPPLQLWSWGFLARLVAAGLSQFIVMIFPSGGVTTWYRLAVITTYVFATSMGTIMFVAISAFHAKIADPVIGGTYMTMLATVSNLGGTFPRFFVLRLVDMFTVATCYAPAVPPPVGQLKAGITPVTSQFSCALEVDKHRCVDGGGTCHISYDGYYIVNVICIIFGLITFYGFIKPKARMLQSLPLSAWRLSDR